MSAIRVRNEQLILAAASEEFAANGFDATQTRDIAARAGVPKANLYYYFQTKENLYSKVLLEFVEPLLEASAALRESDDPMIGLRAYIAARIRIAREHHQSLWERACSRRRRVSPHMRHRLTAFASKPAPTGGLCWARESVNTTNHCGSGLAREGVGSANTCFTGSPLSRASPLPQGVCAGRGNC